MTDEGKALVLRKAKEVNDISLEYQLAHAVFACNKLTEQAVKQANEKTRAALQERAKSAKTREDREDVRREMDSLKNPYRIYIEYVNGMPEDGARVVRLPASNQLVIEMPRCLLDKAVKDGWYQNPDAVKKLRKTKAHELGHIVLNLDALMHINGTQGTKDMRGHETEESANLFADELLRLRKERNAQLRQDPSLKDVF
ncbi:MAG: ImmA/IrrE family metallo-endopeptidase [Treponematales bacterium]